MQRMNHVYIAIVEKAIEYMRGHLEDELTTEEIARHVGYSPFHFSRIFKQVTGIAPRHFLSALRIENGKNIMLHSSSSILRTMITVGFRSMGTFSTRFKQMVGLSPKTFRNNMKELHRFTNEYKPVAHDNGGVRPPTITCHLVVPDHFKGLIFIGLFPRPIPDQRPIIGTAVDHRQHVVTFSGFPEGCFHIMAAVLPWSLNPKDYFLADSYLRGKSETAVKVTDESEHELTIRLREPLPFDPPILINLPQLLFEKERT